MSSRKAKVTPETLEEARKLRELWATRSHPSQAVFGETYGIGGQSAVGQFLRGAVPLSLKAAKGFAAGLGCAVDEFSPRLAAEMAPPVIPGLEVMRSPLAFSANIEDAPELRQMKSIPLVGEVKGGSDGYLEELQYPVGHGDGFIEYPTTDSQAYALRVRGDSMHPRYRAGEFIVVSPSVEPQPGDDVVVALRDGRKLLKELNWIRDGEVQLLSVNDGYGPMTIPWDEVVFIQLVDGRVRRSALRT